MLSECNLIGFLAPLFLAMNIGGRFLFAGRKRSKENEGEEEGKKEGKEETGNGDGQGGQGQQTAPSEGHYFHKLVPAWPCAPASSVWPTEGVQLNISG